jgi:hypothetical protein
MTILGVLMGGVRISRVGDESVMMSRDGCCL